MDEKQFLFLVSKRLAGDITSPEAEALNELLSTNKEYNNLYQILFAEGVRQTDESLLDAQQAYAAHFVKMQVAGRFESKKTEDPAMDDEPVRRRVGAKMIWRIAASVLLIVACAGIFKTFTKPNEDGATTKNEVTTKKGSKSRIVLPDGTLVWLNADSKIVYAGNFYGPVRKIQLTGEAFFDVTKDEARPFVIHTKALDITVLGTVFNVRSYPDEKTTVASLIKGSIQVTLHDKAGRKIILKPSEKLKVNNESMDGAAFENDRQTIRQVPQLIAATAKKPAYELDSIHFQHNDTTSLETFWTINKLAFENECLETVVSKLARWYNVEVEIKSEQLKTKHFTAVFEHKSLKEVMEALKLSGRFNYSIKNEKVSIY